MWFSVRCHRKGRKTLLLIDSSESEISFWDWKLDCDVLWQNVSSCRPRSRTCFVQACGVEGKSSFHERKLVFLKFSQLSGCWQGEDAIKLLAHRHDPGISPRGWRMRNYKLLDRRLFKLEGKWCFWPNFRIHPPTDDGDETKLNFSHITPRGRAVAA